MAVRPAERVALAPSRRDGSLAPSRRDDESRRAHPAGRPRPKLRVVPPNTLSPQARRRRARLLAFVLSVSVIGALFAIVALHAVLSQDQIRLNQIQNRADAEETHYEDLRLEVAELESPARIVATAQHRLGMVSPPTITYLTPTSAETDQRLVQPGTLADGSTRGGSSAHPASSGQVTTGTAAGQTPSTWSAVKPYLSDQP